MPVGMTGELIAGRYRMQKRLGAGGMATVFLARDERLERDVAIKRLHADSAEDVGRRFQREAKVGASLNNPNIVSVYDTTTDDEGVLIVMEYVPGHTLRDEIARGPMNPARVLEIVGAVASALDHAHQHGVVHRDVKPANVLIDDRGGQVKLADLGIATAAEHSRITHSGAVLGTASYMAPERLDGGGGDKSVDIYALAAVAFEMLSGRKAIEGSSPLEIARRVASAPPPDLRDTIPGAPEAAAAALERGLAKRPEERQASAGELVRDLSGAYAEQAERERARPAAPITTFTGNGHGNGRAAMAGAIGADSHRPARRWAIPAALALAALLIVGGIAVALSTGGGNGSEKTAGAGGHKAKSHKTKQHSSSAAQQPSSQAPASTPATPAAPAPSTSGGADQSTPTGVVASFYRTSIDDPHAAWLMATDSAHRQLGSEQGFAAGESTLKSIDFPELTVASQTANSATVQFRSVARHTTKTDRCHGTIGVVKGGSGWLVDHFAVNCSHGPA